MESTEWKRLSLTFSSRISPLIKISLLISLSFESLFFFFFYKCVSPINRTINFFPSRDSRANVYHGRNVNSCIERIFFLKKQICFDVYLFDQKTGNRMEYRISKREKIFFDPSLLPFSLSPSLSLSFKLLEIHTNELKSLWKFRHRD